MTSSLRLWVRLGTLLLPIALVLGTTPSCAEDPAPAAPAPAAPAAAEGQSGSQPMTAAELEELVAPVALYPDVVLSAMLPGSTDIVNLVKLQRWVAEQKEPIKELPKDQDFGSDVAALVQFPDVLAWMNDNLDWTQTLGWAVANQQAEVMKAVQSYRAKAKAAGNLESNDKMSVETEPASAEEGADEVIIIEPTNPEIVYVPSYDSGQAAYPGYGYGAWGWGLGFAMGIGGAWLGHELGWGHGDIDINHNTNIGSGNNVGNRPWEPGNRPNRPGNGNRPGAGNRPGNRPGAGNRPGGGVRPGPLPSKPGGGAGRPGAGGVRPPSARPGGGSAANRPGARPSTKPASRPPGLNGDRGGAARPDSNRGHSSLGGGKGPGGGSRPGAGSARPAPSRPAASPSRPQSRPSTRPSSGASAKSRSSGASSRGSAFSGSRGGSGASDEGRQHDVEEGEHRRQRRHMPRRRMGQPQQLDGRHQQRVVGQRAEELRRHDGGEAFFHRAAAARGAPGAWRRW